MKDKINISQYLEKSVFNIEKINKSLIENKMLIEEFVNYSLGSAKNAWRASWILANFSKTNPEILDKYADIIIKGIKKINSNGHLRETIKILLNLNLTEEQTSKVFDICYTLLEDNKRQPSVRSIAFQYLIKVANNYPELKREIIIVFENIKDFLPHGIKHSMEIRIK